MSSINLIKKLNMNLKHDFWKNKLFLEGADLFVEPERLCTMWSVMKISSSLSYHSDCICIEIMFFYNIDNKVFDEWKKL